MFKMFFVWLSCLLCNVDEPTQKESRWRAEGVQCVCCQCDLLLSFPLILATPLIGRPSRQTTWVSPSSISLSWQVTDGMALQVRCSAASPSILQVEQLDKVNRCLARYSPRATTTNWPTNRAPNEPAWPGSNWQKCSFWTKFGCFWAKNPNLCGSK